MRISENWLREWTGTASTLDDIAERLTMAGLEVDAIEPAAPTLGGVVIGRIERCEPHPQADRLQLCTVDVARERPLEIVCGAPNAAVGAVVPVATVGAELPSGAKIKSARLRGVRSEGMLCSSAELGLSSDAAGLWLLPDDAPVGRAIEDYLDLPDRVLDIDLTPNRGDCLSLQGIAREIAVAEGRSFTPPAITAPEIRVQTRRAVYIEAPECCSGYAARCVVDIAPDAESPLWLRERLRRAGVRSINLPVDIGNYVMLELGQPMHAFDADKLLGAVRVRRARAGESIVTLEGEKVALSEETLVIADDQGPVAIAGMIGGQRTAVDSDTRNVVLESACFAPSAVAGQGRRYKIHTDSLHRYERGVDPALHPLALDRASGLLVELGGAQAGPVTQVSGQAIWPEDRRIPLSADNVERLLGQAVAPEIIERTLTHLGIAVERKAPNRWCATPPSWRFDLDIEADVIEEIARVYGYDRLEAEVRHVELPAVSARGLLGDDKRAAAVLRQRGYNEAITYSFVERDLHSALTNDAEAVRLDNPISDQLVEMRRTLWASLLPSWAYNTRRQQATVRLFENGLRFVPDGAAENGIAQIPTLAGLVAGMASEPHWSETARGVDFFDIKGDVEALFAGSGHEPVFESARHPALHPGRSARIRIAGKPVGFIGQLSPEFRKKFKNKEMPYLFEIDSKAMRRERPVRYQPISEQPQVRRDLAVVVGEQTPVGALRDAIAAAEIKALQRVEVFDVFRGQGLETGFKSVALGLIFQDKASTLTDQDVDTIISRVVEVLRARCGAHIRGE